MNLLDIAQQNGRTYKRVSTEKGGEYHGPCPAAGCGGTDRFHIWPNQGEHGTFWCRGCGLAGDAIEYLMKIEGKSFPAACKELGRELPDQEDYQAPHFKRPASETFTPRETTAPADLWIQHATKLVEWAHQQLLETPGQLAWLAARGLDIEAVKRYRLGWNPGEKGKDLYRVRESWGLDSVFKDDGTTKKKLWIPVGLVIPCFVGDELHRIRIRRPEGDLRYYLIPGSGTSPMILPPRPQGEGWGEGRAWTIVESELDALLIHHLAGDLTGAISQGNSTAKPDAASQALLQQSLAILVALDSDDAGMNAALWWKKQYPQAERWPVPAGKDPGEAYKAGVDIREWIKEGLPPILTLPKPAPKAVQPRTTNQEPQTAFCPQDNPGAESPAPPPEPEPQQPAITRTLTAKDGRTYHITNNPADYARLLQAGEIVFDFDEIKLVIQSGADQNQAALYLDAKKTFPGIRVQAVRPDTAAEPAPTWQGKFAGQRKNS